MQPQALVEQHEGVQLLWFPLNSLQLPWHSATFWDPTNDSVMAICNNSAARDMHKKVCTSLSTQTLKGDDSYSRHENLCMW